MTTKMSIQSLLSYMLLIGILCYVHGSETLMGQRNVPPPNITSFDMQNDPDSVTQIVQGGSNDERRKRGRELGGVLTCATGNPIDDCWRCDPNWERNRKRLADCGVGFGKDAIGGKNGRFYVVTDPRDNPASPANGTLRHAVIQTEPLWIIFQRNMVIKLKAELMMNSFKTIDGRGANVYIGNFGPCFTVQNVNNIIIHGLYIRDCTPAGNTMIRDSPTHVGLRQISEGDGISIFTSRHIWVDHCSMSNCADGLIDVVGASTAVTISNNYFTRHNDVMLFGHNDGYTRDRIMKVTVAFNHFGKGLRQRMPRCRFGNFHIVNNDYTEWGDYAIGGSANPTILSQGNRFLASANLFTKDVTRRESTVSFNEWKYWNWKSEGDMLLNGANFTQSGSPRSIAYAAAYSMRPRSSAFVGQLTRNAGVIICRRGIRC